MKKNMINKLVLIFTLGFGLFSCTDLEENPVGLLAPESYFKSEVEVEAAVNGAYSRLLSESVFGRKLTLTINLLDDICDIGDPGTPSRRTNINSFNPDASNGMITAFWPEVYRAIGAANAALKGLETITVSNPTKANQLEGEARIVRALCYFYLVRLFGEVPYIKEFVTDPASVGDISKTSVDEIYQNIIEDCIFASENLPDKYTNDIRSRPTKGSAKTMLASVYLTLGQYDEAAQYAENVINNASTYGYELVDDFTELWKADNGDMVEHIWTVDLLAGISQEWWSPLTGVSGSDMGAWSVVVPSPGFYGLFEPGDHRMETTFVTETSYDGALKPYTEWQFPRIHFGKFSLYPSVNARYAHGGWSGWNLSIYRFAEVYLIAAEALAEANGGPTAKAYEYINKVRERARFGGTVPADLQSGLSKDDFINEVLKERMREFPLEYKRWFDIKRRQLGDDVFKGANSLEPHSNFTSSKNYLLPLPQDELDRNPNLMPQNPGY